MTNNSANTICYVCEAQLEWPNGYEARYQEDSSLTSICGHAIKPNPFAPASPAQDAAPEPQTDVEWSAMQWVKQQAGHYFERQMPNKRWFINGVHEGYAYADFERQGEAWIDAARRLGRPAAPAQDDRWQALLSAAREVTSYWLHGGYAPGMESNLISAVTALNTSPAAPAVQASDDVQAVKLPPLEPNADDHREALRHPHGSQAHAGQFDDLWDLACRERQLRTALARVAELGAQKQWVIDETNKVFAEQAARIKELYEATVAYEALLRRAATEMRYMHEAPTVALVESSEGLAILSAIDSALPPAPAIAEEGK